MYKARDSSLELNNVLESCNGRSVELREMYGSCKWRRIPTFEISDECMPGMPWNVATYQTCPPLSPRSLPFIRSVSPLRFYWIWMQLVSPIQHFCCFVKIIPNRKLTVPSNGYSKTLKNFIPVLFIKTKYLEQWWIQIGLRLKKFLREINRKCYILKR